MCIALRIWIVCTPVLAGIALIADIAVAGIRCVERMFGPFPGSRRSWSIGTVTTGKTAGKTGGEFIFVKIGSSDSIHTSTFLGINRPLRIFTSEGWFVTSAKTTAIRRARVGSAITAALRPILEALTGAKQKDCAP